MAPERPCTPYPNAGADRWGVLGSRISITDPFPAPDLGHRIYAIFTMTIHPDVSGKPHVLMMHERIFAHINRDPGINQEQLSPA
jgi:hypothetical protein